MQMASALPAGRHTSLKILSARHLMPTSTLFHSPVTSAMRISFRISRLLPVCAQNCEGDEGQEEHGEAGQTAGVEFPETSEQRARDPTEFGVCDRTASQLRQGGGDPVLFSSS